MTDNKDKKELTSATWTSADEPDPYAPKVYVYGKRVTERHVRAQLKDLGGDALRDYDTGRLSREEAYEMTAIWLRQLMEMR